MELDPSPPDAVPIRQEVHASMQTPVVELASGPIRGLRSEGIYSFKGIPYGADTADTGRFMPPQPPDPWVEVRDAVAYGNRSPQREDPLEQNLLGGREREPMSEDCLCLNVFTPGLDDGGARPVMVWFHGGGFSSLSGSSPLYDGTRLCQRGDVVVVTVNHRLNLFGFLYLEELAGPEFEHSGNVGMLDLIQALEWVRDHAARFGGDPGNVTIFGESGGGAKVSVMMAMPAARGLFHRAIIQSGPHLHAQQPAQASENASKLLAAVGIDPKDLRALRTLPPERFIEAYARLAPQTWGSVHFSPVLDGHHLPHAPWKPAAPEASAHVPLLISTTRTETTLLLAGRDPALFELDTSGLHERLRGWLPRDELEAVVSSFEKLYPNSSPSEIFFLITTDLYARCPAWAISDRKAQQAGAPVWMCELTWDTPLNRGRWMSPHTLDIPMVFDNVGRVSSFAPDSPEAQEIARLMSSAWLAFAKSGNPAHEAIPAWPAYTPEQPTTLLFDVAPKLAPNWRSGEREALARVPLREIRR